MSGHPSRAAQSASGQISIRRQQEPVDGSELPFLVTHWLRNFQLDPDNENLNENEMGSDDKSRKEALEKIQRATADLASAFSTLGAFGTATLPVLTTTSASTSSATTAITNRNATFADLNRRWAGIPTNHLDNLVGAAVSSTLAAEEVVDHSAESNLVNAADEAIHEQRRNPSSGRTVQDAIDLENNKNSENNNELSAVQVKPSLLQCPAKIDFKLDSQDAHQIRQGGKPRSATDPLNNPPLESQRQQFELKTSNAMRRYLDLKSKFGEQSTEIRKLQASLEIQQHTKDILQGKRLSKGASLDPKAMEIGEEEQNSNRVIAQLQRRLGELIPDHEKMAEELKSSQTQALSYYDNTRKTLSGYRDLQNDATMLRPNFGLQVARNNGILRSLESRRVGLSNHSSRLRTLAGTGSATHHGNRVRKAMVVSRYSHAVTINSHLHFPVYCLRFDRTGRYFVTGADDLLVKLFCLGAKQAIDASGKGRLGVGQEQSIRGAVHVCTLRGHLGVINDIDISSDNCLVATASEDGDCRVWGLKDGCPVAILRGHVGGCNMVTWSKLTPYRLVTTGEDGLARTWDIREAALKRYGAIVGKRPEYLLRLTQEEKETTSGLRSEEHADNGDTTNNAPEAIPPPPENNGIAISADGSNVAALPDHVPLQPLPVRAAGTDGESSVLPDHAPLQPLPAAENNPPVEAPLGALPDQAPLQPLPQPPSAANNAAGDGVDPANQQIIADGADAHDGSFVANDNIDEGVKLLAKFQHGVSSEERSAAPGPGTRSRKAVRVICVSRCPLGGHFATGADDGICRLWEDSEDLDVEIVDSRSCNSTFAYMGGKDASRDIARRRSTRGSVGNRLLLQLKGHLNAITDLDYSHAGDRILTGSQKDGVVRIWSWTTDPTFADKDSGLRHIVIKLTNPMSAGTSDTRKPRRRAQGSSAQGVESKIELDTATWTHDDSKIITSQSQPHQRNEEIQPDSQFFFVWDSTSGHCLLGIAGAHSKPSPVILAHPTDSSIFCSGGMDGYLKVWDCETGRCLYTHQNVVDYSQMDPAERGKLCSKYCDGAFFPDGSGFLLTDGHGCISVFDSFLSSKDQQSNSWPSPPYWMKEQYSTNDYYDLFYDTNGYCVERGSQKPPHLVRGTRCSPIGSAYAENVTDAFEKLVGPLPLPVRDSRWLRESIRARARLVRGRSGALRSPLKSRRGNVMQEYDPLTTILIRSTGEVVATKNAMGEIVPPSAAVASTSSPTRPARASPMRVSPVRTSTTTRTDPEERRQSSSGRQLSSNYRWRDYQDMLQDERNFDEESDDEEFQPLARRNNHARDSDGSDDDDLEAFQHEHRQQSNSRQASRPAPSRRSTGGVLASSPLESRPSRISSRRRSNERNKNRYSDSSDEEDFEDQVCSTNNDPTGPYVEDYNTHHFRVTSNGPHISRRWLQRPECDSSYSGRRIYAPQVGETVVYIPRAHFETIENFPTLKAAWQHWPAEAEWPVVCCYIRDIRYRFPYKNYFGGRKSGPKCNSIVAIVTLEVTGIPVMSQDRQFNWPSPSFVPPAKSHIFELGIFESGGQEEFLIPHDRYMYRLQCLEEAILRHGNSSELNVELGAYFDDEHNDDEDPELMYFRGRLDDYGRDDEEPQNDANLKNCGYLSLRMSWPDSDGAQTLSPWEAVVEKPKSTRFSPSRPALSDEDKIRAREALQKIRRATEVREYFTDPVNERKYYDYSYRVEVPMNFTLIDRRLNANYYSTKYSLVADVKLIRDNCLKYNGEVGGLQDSARKMYEDFEKEMLSAEERSIYHDLKLSVTGTSVGESGSRSSLANLPPPESQADERRRSLRIRIDTTQAPRDTTRHTRSHPSEQESAHSIAFANASRGVSARQTRRRSNERVAPAPPARQQNVAAGEHELPGSPSTRGTRQSSRVRESLSSLEAIGGGTASGAVAASSPARRTRSHDAAFRGETHEEDSPSGSESDAKPAARPIRRSARSTKDVEHSESSNESESESETEHKSSTRPARGASSRRGSRKPASSEFAQRKRKARGDSSDSEESEEEEEAEDESDASPPPAKRSVRDTPNRSPAAARSRSSSRARTQAQPMSGSRRTNRSNSISYAEQSESEFDEVLSDSSEDEDPSPKKRAASRATSKKPAARRQPTSRRPRSAPKRRRSQVDDSSDEDDGEELVATKRTRSLRSPPAKRPPRWKEIDKKYITDVTLGVLEYMRNLDDDNLFWIPVVEAYPQLTIEYTEVIRHPMDFRTIQEERLPYYQSITELQDDLIQVFENCIKFNGATSDFGKQARGLCVMLNDAFYEVLDDVLGS